MPNVAASKEFHVLVRGSNKENSIERTTISNHVSAIRHGPDLEQVASNMMICQYNDLSNPLLPDPDDGGGISEERNKDEHVDMAIVPSSEELSFSNI